MKPKSLKKTNRKAQIGQKSYETSTKVTFSTRVCMYSTIFDFLLNSIFLLQILHSLDFNPFVILSAVSRVIHIGSRKSLVIFFLNNNKIKIITFTVSQIFHYPKFSKFLISLK